MRIRHTDRLATTMLPVDLVTAVIVSGEAIPVESTVENLSSLGVRVKVVAAEASAMPIRNDIVTIRLPERMDLSAQCVWSAPTEPGNFDLAFYFYKPHEQNALHKLLSAMGLPPHSDWEFDEYFQNGAPQQRFIPHEWEEVVDMMCHSDNPELRAVGLREMEGIKFKAVFSEKQP